MFSRLHAALLSPGVRGAHRVRFLGLAPERLRLLGEGVRRHGAFPALRAEEDDFAGTMPFAVSSAFSLLLG